MSEALHERVRAVRRVGESAVLVECEDLEGALAVFAALESARGSGALVVDELLPAAVTVLVRGGEAARPREFAGRLENLLTTFGRSPAQSASTTEIVIPVSYSGEDLAEVAALVGMSEQQVVSRHSAVQYTVAFTGFAPGFAYLAGGDPALKVPRRATPRPRIDAGSVGLAGEFSAVYPRESPGGWQLIGRTRMSMWDLELDPPALLVPGTRVRFAVERESFALSDPAGAVDSRPAAAAGTRQQAAARPALKVREPGLQTVIQDRGRTGLSHLGVSTSGAADRAALDEANRLAGNEPTAAVLELSYGAISVDALRPLEFALAGAPRAGVISGPQGERAVSHGRASRIDAGETLTLSAAPEQGMRTVFAIRGGIAAPLTLGSASRDTLAGLGPAPLAAGDTLEVGGASGSVAGPAAPAHRELPSAGSVTVLRVTPGPRDDWFDAPGLERFWHQSWQVSPRSDRVGVRLAGDAVTRNASFAGAELPSEGLVTGAIQVPPDGQPVLFLADRPLTGGYPVIGVVCDQDQDLIAQLPPGALVKFQRTEAND